jgi:two-component system sensor histidine kinase YesM
MFHLFFRTRLFNRIVLIFSFITILTFCTLAVLVYKFSMNSMVQKEVAAQRQAVDNVSRFLDQQVSDSQEMVLQLYQNKQQLNDVLYFLRHDFPLYIQYRLNNYIASNSVDTDNMDSFIRKQLRLDPDLLQVAVYSHRQSVLFMFNSNKTQYLHVLGEDGNRFQSVLETLRYRTANRTEGLPIRDILQQSEPGAYTITYDLNDPDTLQNEGTLILTYRPGGIARVLASTDQKPMGYDLVLFPDGYVAYDSRSTAAGQPYPNAAKLQETGTVARLDKRSYTAVTHSAKSSFLVAGIIPLADLSERYASFRGRMLAFTVVAIGITIVFSYIAILRYARRTQAIVRAMKQAQQGNLNFRVPVNRDDELDQIAVSFNQMCEELDSYIKQVYVAGIRQKESELIAFQAQINPHFLYNTLEAIRMSAMSNGASEAGDMLYSLGALFRYAVRPEALVTLAEEADYCRQYLDLYRVRFRDKIRYRIDIPDRFRSVPVFKLLLQPLVENAIVHGIRPSRHGNLVTIRAFTEAVGGPLYIEVEDNGKGMEPEQVMRLCALLADHSGRERSQSLGIRSVHERLRLTYGEEYGLSIQSEPGVGTCCRISLPYGGYEGEIGDV